MIGRLTREASALLLLVSLAACQSPGLPGFRLDRQEAADEFQGRLEAMPGVNKVQVEYELGPFAPAS